MRKDIKASCQKRLSRIEGQVRGLSKMVEEDRYCIDIVTQISAVRAALRRVEEEVLRDHVAHCVEHAITSGNKADQREKIAEVMAVIGRADREGVIVARMEQSEIRGACSGGSGPGLRFAPSGLHASSRCSNRDDGPCAASACCPGPSGSSPRGRNERHVRR